MSGNGKIDGTDWLFAFTNIITFKERMLFYFLSSPITIAFYLALEINVRSVAKVYLSL